MPDPDLPPVTLTEEYIAEIKAEMPELPDDFRAKFADIGIDKRVVEDIIAVPGNAIPVRDILEKAGPAHAKRAAFWILWKTGDVNLDELGEGVSPAPVAELIGIDRIINLSQMVEENKLSSTAAKDVFYEMINDRRDPEEIAKSKNLLQVSDKGEIAKIVAQVLSDNPKAAEDVKNGEMKAIGFLVGQVMKQSKGKANPGLAQQLIKKQLEL